MKIDLQLDVPVPIPRWARTLATGATRWHKKSTWVYTHWPHHRLNRALCWLEGPNPNCRFCGHGESSDLDLVAYRTEPRKSGSRPPYDYETEESE